MFDYGTAGLIIALLMGLVLLGVHVAVALGITSAIGIFLVTGKLRIVDPGIDGRRGVARFHFRRDPVVHADGRIHWSLGSHHRYLRRH